MIDQAIIDSTAAAIIELDFSAENAEIAELEAKIQKSDEAMARARARVAEISELLPSLREPTGLAVADALLAGADPQGAAAAGPSVEKLEEERGALQLGVREISAQCDRHRAAIENVRRSAKNRLAAAAADLVSEVEREAEQAVRRLLDCFATFEAIRRATGAAQRQAQAARELALAAMGDHGLIGAARADLKTVPVPGRIREALAEAAAHGPAVRPGLISEAHVY